MKVTSILKVYVKNFFALLICFSCSGCYQNELTFYRSGIDEKTNKCDGNLYLKFVYTVDLEKNLVFRQATNLANDELISFETLDNCKIFNSTNFTCGNVENGNSISDQWAVSNGKHLHKAGYSFSDFIKTGKELERCWYTKGIFTNELVSQ